MNVLDSSAWIEYFRGSSLAPIFLPIVKERKSLIVPAIAIYEVHKWALLEKGEDEALAA